MVKLYPTILLAIQAAALTITPIPRSPQICYSSETTSLLCYEGENGTPQNTTVDDITFVASYLRSYGRQLRAGRFFTMGSADAPNCDEWTLYTRGSVLALAKHLDSSLNSSVLFEDIATTIDGGGDAEAQGGIISCLESGGSLGVLVNATNAAYNTSAYAEAGYTPDGILIKIVTAVSED